MRWIIRIIGLFLVLAVVGLGALFLLPGDRIARIAAGQIERTTGRAVILNGDTTISIWPVLGVATGPMSVANADWSNAGPMMEADSLKIGVDFMALLQGSVRITGMDAAHPVIRLEKAADGRVNWELGVDGVSPSGPAATHSNPLRLTLDRALISDADISFSNHQTGAVQRYSDVDFELHWPDPDGAADLVLSLRPAGDLVELRANISDINGLIASETQDIDATLSLGGGKVRFAGTVDAPLALNGRLTGDLPDTADAIAALGLTRADIPKGLGRSLKLGGELSFADGRLRLADMQGQLDQNAIAGTLALTFDETPRLTGEVTTGDFDLSDLSSGSSSNEDGPKGWSKSRIDASALSAANADLTIRAKFIDLGQYQLDNTVLRITNDRARAVIDIERLEAYGGRITGDFVMNNRAGLLVGGRLNAADVDMQALLGAAAGLRRFKADGNARVEFLGVGNSIDAILRSLKGSGQLSTGRGVIDGIDLDRLMRGDMTTGGTTVFDTMGASFAMASGVLTNKDLSLKTPIAKATGQGQVDIGQQSLDYTITPISITARDGRGLAVPVRVRGAWSNPKISIDLERAVKQNFQEELDRAEDRARQRVEDEVGKALDVEREEGQSLEDAVKNKLEDELQKGLQGLFK